MNLNESTSKRVGLLLSSGTYRARSFLDAADRLGVRPFTILDIESDLSRSWTKALGVPFSDLDASALKVASFATEKRLDALLAVDDAGVLLAANASELLGLPSNSPSAAKAARDKHTMRQLLENSTVPIPSYALHHFSEPAKEVGQSIEYPAVIKPRMLTGSRGVMRVDTLQEFLVAVARLHDIVAQAEPHAEVHSYLVEEYVPGIEIALDGVVDGSEVTILAVYDKPIPMEGPFFEETIYVTPSELVPDLLDAVSAICASAASAIGLSLGPIHAEFRINGSDIRVIEIAGRSIGGNCSQVLQFDSGDSLEELVLKNALGMPMDEELQSSTSRGVMMIPAPGLGILRSVSGVERALAEKGVESVEISAKIGYPVVPLPEGESYVGFIFAEGPDALSTQRSLERAHECLRFDLAPYIPLRVRL